MEAIKFLLYYLSLKQRDMHSLTGRSFNIQFTYLKKIFNTDIKQVEHPQGYVLYQLKFDTCKYLFIHHNDEWKVIANFQPCQKLKKLIIKNLERVPRSNNQFSDTEVKLHVVK
jgi:hypothetical protein